MPRNVLPRNPNMSTVKRPKGPLCRFGPTCSLKVACSTTPQSKGEAHMSSTRLDSFDASGKDSCSFGGAISGCSCLMTPVKVPPNPALIRTSVSHSHLYPLPDVQV